MDSNVVEAHTGRLFTRSRAAVVHCIKVGAGLALALALFAVPAHADLADDIAAAEREIEIRALARELVRQASARADAATKASSIGQRYVETAVVCEKVYDRVAARRLAITRHYGLISGPDGYADLDARTWRHSHLTDAQKLDYLTAIENINIGASIPIEKCDNRLKPLEREMKEVYDALLPKFIDNELDKYISQLLNETEERIFRDEVERLTI